jgi:hypothetical protein
MKKTYIIPTIQIVHLTAVSMLALSAELRSEEVTDFGTKEESLDDVWDD